MVTGCIVLQCQSPTDVHLLDGGCQWCVVVAVEEQSLNMLTCVRHNHTALLSHMLQACATPKGLLTCCMCWHIIVLHSCVVTRTARAGRHRAQQGRGEWARV